MTWPYAGRQPSVATLSRDDLIGPLNYRLLGDLVYSGLGTYQPPYENYSVPEFRTELLPCLQPSTVLWVYAKRASLGRFFDTVMPRIEVPFVLVTGDSDDSAPARYPDQLQDPRVLHWFATNCDLPYRSDRLTCLPLGLPQWTFRNEGRVRFYDVMLKLLRDGHGLQNGILPSSQHPKSKVLLVAFTHNRTRYRRDPRRRERLWAYACKGPLRAVSTCLANPGLEATYLQAAQHQFVLAPEGAGMDTFRAWETLLLGSYPVVINNSLTPLYDGLPVLVVRNATELTPALLAATYDAFRGRRWDHAPLYMGHHFAAVGGHRLGQSKEYRLEYRLRRP